MSRRETIAMECVTLKHRLGELGLWQTLHQMERVITCVGFELAGDDPVKIAEYMKKRFEREQP